MLYSKRRQQGHFDVEHLLTRRLVSLNSSRITVGCFGLPCCNHFGTRLSHQHISRRCFALQTGWSECVASVQSDNPVAGEHDVHYTHTVCQKIEIAESAKKNERMDALSADSIQEEEGREVCDCGCPTSGCRFLEPASTGWLGSEKERGAVMCERDVL